MHRATASGTPSVTPPDGLPLTHAPHRCARSQARQRLLERAPSPPPAEPARDFAAMGAGQGATAADAGPARCGRRASGGLGGGGGGLGGGGGGGGGLGGSTANLGDTAKLFGEGASLFGEAASAGRPAEPGAASHSSASLAPPGRQEGGPAMGRRAGRRGAPATSADDALSDHFPSAAALGAPPPGAGLGQGAPSWLRDDPPKPSQNSPRPGKGALPWEPPAGAPPERSAHVGHRTGAEKPPSEKPPPRKHDFSAASQPAAAPKKTAHDFSAARGVDASAPPAAPLPPKPAGSGKPGGKPKRGGKTASQPAQPAQHASHAAAHSQHQPRSQQQPPRAGGPPPKTSRPKQAAPHAPPPGGEARAKAYRATAEAGELELDGLAQASAARPPYLLTARAAACSLLGPTHHHAPPRTTTHHHAPPRTALATRYLLLPTGLAPW